MASSSHLKRESMPKSWPSVRKGINFITKPLPGSYKIDYVVPAVVLFREVLGYAKTAREVKYILHNEEILVNGKKITDIKFPCGLFDVIEIKKTNEKFVILFDKLGKLKLVPTKENNVYLRISSANILKGKKFQLNFMNGFNILVDEKTFKQAKVQDSVVYDFVKKKIVSILPLKEKASVYVFDGKYKGFTGEVIEFTNYFGKAKDLIKIKSVDGVEHITAKEYAFVILNDDLKRFA